MSIEWFDSSSKDGIATLYESNITLNKNTIRNIEDAYSVMLGIDAEKKQVVIKPLNKEQDMRGDIPQTHKYKITIRSSYGRIANKDFMRKIEKIGGFTLSVPKKFKTIYDDDNNLVIIDLGEER
ncbi:MAG: hypothetical protein J6Y28_09250 [Acholeplasmatales bacterium]|nr:hypothetical protein [Acholeplasmatales bacterium]